MDPDRDEERLHRILRAPSVSAPPFAQLQRLRARPSASRSIGVTIVAVLVAIAAFIGGRELTLLRQQEQGAAAPGASSASPTASARVVLPLPIVQPLMRISAAAQVAWVGIRVNGGPTTFVGVDPAGRIAGRISGATMLWRSPDEAHLFAVGNEITEYSALDGRREGSYVPTAVSGVSAVSFSPDGRWLALLGRALSPGGDARVLQSMDLETGRSFATDLTHSANATQLGSTLVFSPDSQHLYTIVDWGGPLRLTAFDVTPDGPRESATAVDGQNGRRLSGCGGPAIAARVVDGGRTLVTFCYADAEVDFIDLATLTSVAQLHPKMANPFWIAPVFTPDDRLLYLHQYPAFGDQMQVVDLRTHALLGPVPTPKKLSDPSPFAWLFPVAYAGGTPSTVPVSPDGLHLYVADDGITVLRIPDLRPIAKLAPGVKLNEIWPSADGRTLFASDTADRLYVVPAAGGSPVAVTLDGTITGFVAWPTAAQ